MPMEPCEVCGHFPTRLRGMDQTPLCEEHLDEAERRYDAAAAASTRTARTIIDRRDFLVQVGNDDTHWETCNRLTLRQAANPAERKDAMQRSRNVYGAERDGVPLDVRVVEQLHVATELDRL